MVKVIGDLGATGVIIGSISAVLPPISALFAIVWFAVQIYESKTMQDYLNRNKED